MTIKRLTKENKELREGIEKLIKWCERYHGGDVNGNDIEERLNDLLSKDIRDR
jgi:hypothetical protein